MTGTIIPYRSTLPAGRDDFLHLLRAEWTKFRTVRGWVIGTAVAALFMVLFGLLGAAGSRTVTNSGPGTPDRVGHRTVPTGPDGEAVTDSFYFVHQPLDGDGGLTARVTSLAGVVIPPGGGASAGQGGTSPTGPGTSTPTTDGVQPWTKAGLIIKENTAQGSTYAAIMVTGGHGVRMQYNYTRDTAGPSGAVSATAPRWLRLTRTGDTLTGYASTDGTRWTAVGTVRLSGLPSTVQAGLFVASPGHETFDQFPGGSSSTGSPTVATATFDAVNLPGRYPGNTWSGLDIGGDDKGRLTTGGFRASGGTFTVTGSGDIAPNVDVSGHASERALGGTFATLTVMVVLGVLFITTEYRRGLIRTSLAASPRRGRILAAKATVIGAITFATGLAAAAITLPLSERILRAGGNAVLPVPWLTEVRIVAGSAALLAVVAVLAVAVGTILRRSVGAVAAVIVLTVLPYILAVSAVLPAGPAQWLLRLTPAAAFAIQQSIPVYPQVDHAYTPAFGFYPLEPWAGFAVLCGWTALALGLAAYLLRRRDA
jgi:ABC-type transport system involved in multi-copper enzyme maturation permease subunit